MKLRGKFLFFSLLATGVIAALLGIVQMWWEPLIWEIFGKVMVTLLICGTLASFLIAVDYDLPGSKSKTMLAAAVILGLILAGLVLSQIWLEALQWDVFIKLVITDIVLLALVSFLLAVKEDFGTNQKLKDEKYID